MVEWTELKLNSPKASSTTACNTAYNFDRLFHSNDTQVKMAVPQHISIHPRRQNLNPLAKV